MWPITSLEDLKAKSVELVQSAQKSILLSCWADELAWLKTYLEQVDPEGVKIALVHFSIPNCNIGATYHHPAERTLYAEKGGRGLTIVVDSREVVIANISDGGRFEAVCSRNQAFATVAEDYVKHDVYITKVTKHLGPEVRGRYGEHFEITQHFPGGDLTCRHLTLMGIPQANHATVSVMDHGLLYGDGV